MATRDDGKTVSFSGRGGSPRAPVQQRLHDGFHTDRRYLSQMVVEAQNERSTRVEAVLALKHDLDTSSAKIGAQSSAYQAQIASERAHQARTHQSLLDQGKNPYEVARRKVVQREAKQERLKIERNIQNREVKLLERLEAEKRIQKRQEKVEAENRAYERKYQREMGRAAQEERTHAYLLSRTGKESLDPTGKLVRVYPSQETTMKDNTFGLGNSAVITPEHRRRIVSKVHTKTSHAGAEANSMLLPRRRKQHSQQESKDPAVSSGRSERDENDDLKASERLIMPSLSGATPGQDLLEVNHGLLLDMSVKLPPIAGNGSRRLHDHRQEDEENQATDEMSTTIKRKKPRGRSILEERQLAKARQRQKDSRFTQSQVVWGKTFTGNAFLANPPMLWFKDFDVRRPLTLGFTLTNISNTFNQFRLLPMDDDVIELFDIVYDKPGRMSAGMSCALKMTFTGMEGRDLDTTLSIAAPTGVYQLPVRCTCKKAVPILSQREIRFPDVIAGERSTINLTLANEGALPLEFRLSRVIHAPEEPVDFVLSSDVSTGIENVGDEEVQEAEIDSSADVANEAPIDLQEDNTINENPQEDNGEHLVEGAVDGIDETQNSIPAESRVSCASSAATTKTSATNIKLPETVVAEDSHDDVNDPLNPEEQGLVDRALEKTLFKPEGADEPVRFTKRGIVAPYSSTPVSFTFAPTVAMTVENQQFVLEFPASSSSGISSPDLRRLACIPVLVSGVALQVPIFVSRSRLDFHCCAYGKLYRHELVVCNRGKVALKVQVQIPKALVGYVEFNPGFGFVQAAVGSHEGKFPLQVKFRPDERMWKRIERAGLGSRDQGMLAVPVQVMVPDQVVPVYFLLTVRLTHTALRLQVITTGSSEDGLHFGACCVGNSVSLELMITNSSRVPQRIGVTTLPKDVTIADSSEGVGFVLLPDEARTLQIVYTPKFPGVLKAAGAMGRSKPMLTLWSSTFNQEYTMSCSGSGVASDLTFSQSAVRLGATSLGQMQTCNVNMINQSDRHTYLVELRPPPEAAPFLRITPLVARLGPRETVRLEIDFEPTEDIFKLLKRCYLEAKSSDESASVSDEDTLNSVRSAHADMTGEQPKEEGLSNIESDSEENPATSTVDTVTEPRSCHHTWTILCFHQQEGNIAKKHSLRMDEPTLLQALEVRTTVVEPFVIPSTTMLDFGQVAIGQTLVRDLTMESTACVTENVLLRAQPLHILGAFRLIGALREIPGNSLSRKKRSIRVEFEPRTPLMYEDELELSAMGVCIRVRLRGEGINPSLSLTPADGKIDFQDVLARTRTVRELVLVNGSAFPLAFSIVAFDDTAIQQEKTGIVAEVQDRGSMSTTTGLPAFTLSPTAAIIPENSSLSVQVIFQPDHQRPGHYARRYRIQVPNENEQHIICLSGRCWENQLYVFAPTTDVISAPAQSCDNIAVKTSRRPLLTPRPVEDLFDLPPSISLTQLPSSIGVNDLPAAGLRKPGSSFVLTFNGDESIRSTLTSDKSNSNIDVASPGRITKTLFIGSTTPSSGIYGGLDEVTPAATGGSAGSFELVVDATSPYSKLFTLEPARGAIAAGQQLAIQVTYSPPASTSADTSTTSNSVRPGGAATSKTLQRRPELEVMQWVQIRVQCILKGGSLWRVLPAIGAASATSVVPGAGTVLKGANAGTGATTSDGGDTRVVIVILRARLEI